MGKKGLVLVGEQGREFLLLTIEDEQLFVQTSCVIAVSVFFFQAARAGTFLSRWTDNRPMFAGGVSSIFPEFPFLTRQADTEGSVFRKLSSKTAKVEHRQRIFLQEKYFENRPAHLSKLVSILRYGKYQTAFYEEVS